MASRDASHAGSWYSADPRKLAAELDRYLDQVPSVTTPIGTESAKHGEVRLPTPGARAIIAPHAGYAYSGPAAAWAYKALDLSHAKRIFLLGPSHHHYLSGCALTRCAVYETPLGSLKVDGETVAELQRTGAFELMSQSVDEAEHSLEMHLPYIYRMCQRAFSDDAAFPLLVPIMVGNTSPSAEQRFGAVLAPYLADPSSVFVISSDFAHWGLRFRYTYYEPVNGPPTHLRAKSSSARLDRPIHESIAAVDQRSMDAVETGAHGQFLAVLEATGNTVCGRHPIGVTMAAIERLRTEGKVAEGKGRFTFIRYERSSDVEDVYDSSVSYCSAFAVF